MTSIDFAVDGAVASATLDGVLTAGAVGIPVNLSWDADWDDLVKTLVCQSGTGKHLVLRVEDTAVVPPAALRLDKFGRNTLFLGLEGRNPEGTLVLTSTLARVGEILPGAIAEGDPAVIPGSPAWMHVVGEVRELKEQVSAMEEALWLGKPGQSQLPEGGSTGQVLAKKSDANQDAQWIDLPEKGTDGYTPVKGTDYWTEADKQEILDEDVVFLSQELAKRQQLTPEYADDISGCTDTSKLYVLPDGFIYAYILGESTGTKTETVVPAWQLGMKLDKSTGAESSGGQYTACEPIYIADGETYVFSVANNYYLNGVACWYGSSGNYLGYTEAIASASSPGAAAAATLKPLTGAAYFRLRLYHIWDVSSNSTSVQAQLNKATMTKTVPEASETYGWNSTGHAFVPADYEDRIVSLESAVNALKGDMSIFGIVDGQKQITLTGALEKGTYTIQYQDADGQTVDIGSFQIGG